MKKIIWLIKTFFNLHHQPVYYSPSVNRFFQVKVAQGDGLWCGDFCGFYNDAQTTIQRQLLSYDYVWKCKMVTSLDNCPYAEIDSDIQAWRVKGLYANLAP